ncbi:hypothetical protein LXL04_039306 [Taraxacum kok-saghyz]
MQSSPAGPEFDNLRAKEDMDGVRRLGSPHTTCIRCTECERGCSLHGLSLAYEADLNPRKLHESKTVFDPSLTRELDNPTPIYVSISNQIINKAFPHPQMFPPTDLGSFFGNGGVIKLTRWFEKTESVFQISSCAPNDQVKYAACSFANTALSWWNGHVQTIGITTANSMSWDELKTMKLEEYYPRSEVQNLEQEFWNLTMKGSEKWENKLKIRIHIYQYGLHKIEMGGQSSRTCPKIDKIRDLQDC